MPRGKTPNNEPTVQLKVYIPESLAARLQLAVFDPLRARTRYGSASGLIVTLLRKHFNMQGPTNEGEKLDEGGKLDGLPT